jgi:TPR repeat protein
LNSFGRRPNEDKPNTRGAYYNGNGVAKDVVQGARWLSKAAEGGYLSAQCDLDVMYQNGVGVEQSYSDALKWYRKAAEQGDALACHNLGSLHAKASETNAWDLLCECAWQGQRATL